MALPKSPLRLGVIGCGNVLSAYRTAIDTLRARGEVDAVIACGREAQRETARAALGPVRFTTDAEEVITSPDVDLVIILTSMPEHARLAAPHSRRASMSCSKSRSRRHWRTRRRWWNSLNTAPAIWFVHRSRF